MKNIFNLCTRSNTTQSRYDYSMQFFVNQGKIGRYLPTRNRFLRNDNYAGGISKVNGFALSRFTEAHAFIDDNQAVPKRSEKEHISTVEKIL